MARSISRRDFHRRLAGGALLAGSALSRLKAGPLAFAPPNGTGYVYDERFIDYTYNGGDYPERVVWINRRLEEAGLVESSLQPVSREENYLPSLQAVHTDAHIEGIGSTKPRNSDPESIGTIAHLTVSSVLGAVRDVCTGRVKNAFCNVRPPGHHVIQHGGCIGYCCFGNVAIAAHYAQNTHDVGKILIIDWDYHQGNGTHSLICGNEDILFFETFAPYMYNTDCNDLQAIGPEDRVPDGAMRINVRMPSGSTNEDFLKVFEEKLVPAVERVQPELILISSGFDCKLNDSHGSFRVTAAGISRLTHLVMQLADTYAGGKIVSLLEGGYSDVPRDPAHSGQSMSYTGLAQCAENHVRTLLTGKIQPETPYFEQAVRSGSFNAPRLPGLALRGSTITGLRPQTGPADILVVNAQGKVVRTVSTVTARAFDCRTLNLAAGNYTAVVRTPRGERMLPGLTVLR